MIKKFKKWNIFVIYLVFLILQLNFLFSIEITEEWNQLEGVIFNNQSTIWPFYSYGKCPNFDVEVNGINKKVYPLIYFSRINNSHVSLPSESYTQRSLCIAVNNVAGIEIVSNSNIYDILDIFLERQKNSHINIHGEGESVPIYFNGVNSNNYVVSTKLQRYPPDFNYSCIGSINGNDFQGYHFGDCNYNPLKRIWISLEEDFKVWLEAPDGSEDEDSIKVEVKCDSSDDKCEDSTLKLYHSSDLISVCPSNPDLYIYENNYSFIEDGWVCGVGYLNENKSSFTNVLEISVLDFWIDANLSSLIKTSSLSTKINIKTNIAGYCEYSLNLSPFVSFESDVSQYGVTRYSLFHETNIQLKEEDLEKDVSLTLKCYKEDGNDVDEKNYLVRLTEINTYLIIEQDIDMFKGQTKLFNLTIVDEYDNKVYGLKSNQFETRIMSSNNNLYLGIGGVTLLDSNYKLSINSQLEPGNYNVSIKCVKGLVCDPVYLNLEIHNSSLNILADEIYNAYDNVFASNDNESMNIFLGDDLYFDSITGSVNAYEGISLFVAKANDDIKTYITNSKINPTYIIVNDETIEWIIDEYSTSSTKLLLRYIGRDNLGNKIIKIEYIN